MKKILKSVLLSAAMFWCGSALSATSSGSVSGQVLVKITIVNKCMVDTTKVVTNNKVSCSANASQPVKIYSDDKNVHTNVSEKYEQKVKLMVVEF